jgi:hypothetical protein
MEALPWPADNTPGPIQAIPPIPGGYLAQPDMRRLITTALELGSSLWAYEAIIEPGKDQAELLSPEFTNWREREQARNLCQLLASAPGDPLLVWCGNGHACKQTDGEWVPMGQHFTTMSGIQQFVIDQSVTIDVLGHRPRHGCENCWKHSATPWPPRWHHRHPPRPSTPAAELLARRQRGNHLDR